MPNNSFDSSHGVGNGREQRAELYDSLVCERSPYTGELAPPGGVGESCKETETAGSKAPRIAPRERVSNPEPQGALGLLQSAFYRFRYAAARFLDKANRSNTT